MIKTRPLPLPLLLALALCACAGGKDSIDLTKPVSGADAQDAKKAYDKAVEEKKAQNYLDATRYFEFVRNNFPYSQYAALAELALADMAYEREEYAASASSYADFVKRHPSHPKADYAAFRVGVAHYEERPSDMFLVPPAAEKDEGPVREALDAFQRFLLSYPKSEFAPRARDLVAECRERLLAHERYVAAFYWKREVWKGAAGRLLGIADTYGDLEGGRVRAEALWQAGLAFRNAHEPARERTTLQRFLQETGQRDARRDEAEARLRGLPADAERKEEGPAHPAPPSPSPASEPTAQPPTTPAEPRPPPAAPDK